MQPVLPRLLVCLLLVVSGVATVIADEGAAEAPFRFYSVLDGLTQSDVYDIDQDQAGYLWFTTARGLNRYDGKDFEHLTIADGLPSNTLTALHIDSNNSLWIGDTRGEITEIGGGRVQRTLRPSSTAGAEITDIESIGNRLFVAALDVGIVEVTLQAEGYTSKLIATDAGLGSGNIEVLGTRAWIASENGLFELVISSQPRLVLRDPTIRLAHVDDNGRLWVIDRDGRAGTWQDGLFAVQASIDTERDIVNLFAASNGRVWVVTRDELFRFDASQTQSVYNQQPVTRYEGIDEVSAIFVDREQSVWLASESRLIRFLGDRFLHHRLRTGADSETVWSIAQDFDNRFWFGTQTKLLLRHPDLSLQTIDVEHGVPEGAIRDVVTDNGTDIWFSVGEEGLFHIDARTLKARPIAGTGRAQILDLDRAPDGAIWYSTIGSGVFRYDPAEDELTAFAAPEKTSVYTLDVAADGTVWYGADDVGVVRLSPQSDGSYVESIAVTDSIKNRLFDHIRLTGPDSAWIATEEGGLYFYENDTFTEYGQQTPLADQTVYLVEPLPNGTVVVGGEQGLYQFRPGEPGMAHFNQSSGFIGLETNVHATFFDADNYLWIGTVDGATRMDTTLPMPQSSLPVPRILLVETELDRNQVIDGDEIPPSQLGAHVEFAAVSLLSPRGMQYSYRLLGAEEDWGPPTNNQSVSYPRIAPGSYEFMVRARFPGGSWGDQYASHRFTVLPFFWQQPLFFAGVLLAALLLVRAAMHYRTQHMERLNRALRGQVEERTRSIEQARAKLEQSNEALSKEIGARAEMEARFRRAFENAPIGMALLDSDAHILDGNPAMKNMFWPAAEALPEVRFCDAICEEDRERFIEAYRGLIAGDVEEIDERLACVGADGVELQVVVNLSTVVNDSHEFLYSVLQIQDITESLKLTSQLEYQASYDELTGLLNRRAFEAQLQRAWTRGQAGKTASYLMFMDLDQFKVVNDTSGHTAGDQLLQGVADILEDSVRANDIVARLGGDEFGVILWECPTDVATRIAESIRASIEEFRFRWDNEVYRIGVSIGGLPIDSHAGDINELQQLADAACYAAKEAGRNRVHMVSGDKDSARVHRGQVRWVQRIREAMDNSRFAIYAQKIVPLTDAPDEPERLEILLRLRDPETRRLIPPGAFLPAVERYGLSVELDEWVIRSLLNTLFIHEAFQAERRSYWINLSGNSIGDKRFSAFLKDAVKNAPLPPGMLNFEITETAVIRSVSEAGALMSDLREMGCQFALDDFGSGLSSFGYLKKLPVDYLKIDGMFIRDLMRDKTDQIFVKSIIDIAHTLKMKAVAEFVENDELLHLVRDLGADYGQGFALGRPFVFAPQLNQPERSIVELPALQTKAS